MFGLRFHEFVRATVPPGLRRSIRRARARVMAGYGAWRVQPPATRLLGPQFHRSRDRLELDITYMCNLHCFNCNRSCEQARDNGHMSVGQVRQFLGESLARGQRWRLIRVIGGEPTTHPRFAEIIDVLAAFKRRHAPGLRIVVCTNGYGDRVAKILAALPPEILVENTSKVSHVQPDFMTFNVAPLDVPRFARANFTNGCSIMQKCGFGLGPSGYYPCGPGAGIDRVFGFNIGRPTLPSPNDDMHRELKMLCPVCGIFKRTVEKQALEEPAMSPIWRKAYARWAERRPTLTMFPEAPAERDGP